MKEEEAEAEESSEVVTPEAKEGPQGSTEAKKQLIDTAAEIEALIAIEGETEEIPASGEEAVLADSRPLAIGLAAARAAQREEAASGTGMCEIEVKEGSLNTIETKAQGTSLEGDLKRKRRRRRTKRRRIRTGKGKAAEVEVNQRNIKHLHTQILINF